MIVVLVPRRPTMTSIATIPTVSSPNDPDPSRPRLRSLLLRPAVLVVVFLGIALRAWVLLSPLGTLNADEAYTGLQAAEIARGHLPVMMGGAAYTGTTDIYLLTPFVWVLGQHVVLLKLLSPIFWAVASVLAVGAGRRVVSDRTALLAGAMVWLAPGALLVLSTRSYVGYAFGLSVVVALIWSALDLVGREAPTIRTAAVTGALAGLAFYTHPMFGTIVAPIAAVVALRWRRHGMQFWLPAIASGVAVNVPFLAWNVRNSWASLDTPPTDSTATYVDRLRGFFTGLLPRDLGVRRITDDAWLFGRPVAAAATLAVVGLAVFGARQLVRADRWRGAVIAVPLVATWPLMAMLSNLSYVGDGRYGIIVLPVLVFCLAAGVDALVDQLPSRAWLGGAVLWAALATMPFLAAEAGTDLGDPNRQTQALIDVLEAEGFDRVAGNYWAVLPIELQSGGRLRVAVAGNPPVIRLPDTQRLVEATSPDRLAYVFLPGPVGDTWTVRPIEQYRQIPVAGWVIYLPA